MNDKSKELYNMLDSAYNDPEIKGKQELTDLILAKGYSLNDIIMFFIFVYINFYIYKYE